MSIGSASASIFSYTSFRSTSNIPFSSPGNKISLSFHQIPSTGTRKCAALVLNPAVYRLRSSRSTQSYTTYMPSRPHVGITSWRTVPVGTTFSGAVTIAPSSLTKTFVTDPSYIRTCSSARSDSAPPFRHVDSIGRRFSHYDVHLRYGLSRGLPRISSFTGDGYRKMKGR